MNYVQLLFPDFSLILCGFLLRKFTPLNRTPLDLHAASRLLGTGAALAAVGITVAYALPHLRQENSRLSTTEVHKQLLFL